MGETKIYMVKFINEEYPHESLGQNITRFVKAENEKEALEKAKTKALEENKKRIDEGFDFDDCFKDVEISRICLESEII